MNRPMEWEWTDEDDDPKSSIFASGGCVLYALEWNWKIVFIC